MSDTQNQQQISKALRASAAAGDHQAQFQLGALLQRSGGFEEACIWFEKSAKGGNRQGQFTHATILLQGKNGSQPANKSLQAAFGFLDQAAEQQDPAAKRMLALMHALAMATKRDDEKAANLLAEAAMQGFPPAIREAGVLLLLNAKEGEVSGGGMLLRHAAQRGDWIAAWLLVSAAARGELMMPTAVLAQFVTRLRSGGAPLPERFAEALKVANENSESADISLTSDFLQQAILAALSKPPEQEVEESFGRLNIRHYKQALDPLHCDYLIALCAGLMQPSKVVNAAISDAEKQNYRTSDGGVLAPIDQDLVTVLAARQLAVFSGLPVSHSEFIAALRYNPGQQYYPHHDYLEVDEKDYSKIKSCGQRKSTVLLYLNHTYEGGKTEFPELQISVSGKTGDVLRFDNLDETGAPDPQSLHAGQSVKSGEKWLITLWCREKPFWPWAIDGA
jgi:prolyl 4-hydroxylase